MRKKMEKLSKFDKDITMVLICDNNRAKQELLQVLTGNTGGFTINEVALVEDMPVLVVTTSMLGYAYLGRHIDRLDGYELLELGSGLSKRLFVRCRCFK